MTNEKSPTEAQQGTETATPADLPFWTRIWRAQKDNLGVLAIALALAVLLRTFIAEPRFIPSDSMLPTLQVGDRVVVEKVSYHFHPPTTGDIVIFHPPQFLDEQLQMRGYGKGQVFIKRVIGRPGQAIAVQAGKVYLDGKPLEEDYILSPPAYEGGPYVIPEDRLFVMGDNRNNSNDSHVWGFLPEQNVIGRARFRFWPLDRIGLI